MIDLMKDRYKIGLVLASLFFLGIIVSVYSIYSLPRELVIADGYQSSFMKIYTILGLTFFVGAIAIWNALQQKNEVIVFRDKKLEYTTVDKDAAETGQTTISLENVKAMLKQSDGEKEILQSALQSICKQLEAGQGAIYMAKQDGPVRKVELKSGYALSIGESSVLSYEFGEGLVGQVAVGKKTIYADEIPEGYIKILSGLGTASPRFLLIVPIKKDDDILGVMEIASFTPITEDQRKFVEESGVLIADRIAGN
jgi:hypothetical protein